MARALAVDIPKLGLSEPAEATGDAESSMMPL
jgi:hypothetical protein